MSPDFLAALGGRKFFAGTLLAAAILAAGLSGRIGMQDAIVYALMVYGAFTGSDVANTASQAMAAAWGKKPIVLPVVHAPETDDPKPPKAPGQP